MDSNQSEQFIYHVRSYISNRFWLNIILLFYGDGIRKFKNLIIKEYFTTSIYILLQNKQYVW